MNAQAARQVCFFVRHGETESNARGVRCGGDRDIPLTSRGEEQVRAMVPQLVGLGIALIVASPLLRTQRTAAIIAEALGGIVIETAPLFLERRLGEWNGRSIEETEPLLRAKQTPPGGESEAEFRARIERAVESLRPLLLRRPLVVSSKGVARMLNLLFGDPSHPTVGNAEVIRIDL